mgnify:CR=1 FL=1
MIPKFNFGKDGDLLVKHSKQRDAILENLCSRYDHPTAEDLYLSLKPKIPALSLATVYRNLALLESMGDVVKISTNADSDRFDGNVNNHYHFACIGCGGVSDVDMPVNDSIEDKVAELTKADVKTHSLIFYGTCEKCKKKSLTNEIIML